VSGRDDDRPDYLDREKKSFSELDRLRREGGAGGDRPGGARAESVTREASQQYLKQIDGIFGGRKEEVDKLGRAILDARGTPELPAACRAFLAAAGPPAELRHVSCFLEATEPDLVLAGLGALEAAQAAGSLDATPGLRTQLRMLVDHPDDEVAGSAEDLIEAI
jgi:hypothetical protein